MEYLINLYLINTTINSLICLSIYFSLELYRDWDRNRTDFWFILILGCAICFIPVLNTFVLVFVVFLMIIIPLVELVTPYKYSYPNSRFERK